MTRGPLDDVAMLLDIYQNGIAFHCLCAVSRLEIPDKLAGGPCAVAELAGAAGVNADALRRVLKLLASHGVFTFDVPRDLAGLTTAGQVLRREHPMSLRATFATFGISDIAHKLVDTIRTGKPAVGFAVGAGFWEHLAASTDRQATFSQAMTEQARLLTLPCVALLDWPHEGTIADIAGGAGALLAEVLTEEPGLDGILIDQAEVLDRARVLLRDRGVGDRCVLVPGDLFASPPPADIYLLSRVLHDWDDDSVARILDIIAASAPPAGKLRIFEDVLPALEVPSQRQNWSDVVMMALYGGGRERTAAAFGELLSRGGWHLDAVVEGPPGMAVIEASRARRE